MTADDVPERIDLSALDPLRDHERLDASVAAIMQRAVPALERRRAGSGEVVALFVAWTRPMLAAASLLGVLSLGALARYVPAATRADEDGAATTSMEASVAQGIGVPTAMASWVAGEGTPGPGQLLDASRTSGEVR